jgi:hypothetical protein
LQHWYVYHSTKTMKCDYASLGESAAYSTSERRKLCLRDVIWVIEGPGDFALVDCFRYEDADYKPLPAPFQRFKLKAKGNSSYLGDPKPLHTEMDWFHDLHSRYITKQKFFSLIEPNHIHGLLEESGVSL